MTVRVTGTIRASKSAVKIAKNQLKNLLKNFKKIIKKQLTNKTPYGNMYRLSISAALEELSFFIK